MTPGSSVIPSCDYTTHFSFVVQYMDGILPAVVTLVTTDTPCEGISIIHLGNEVSISGEYKCLFQQKYYEYKTVEQGVTSHTPPSELPESYYAMTKFSPDTALSKTVTYTVIAAEGTATITHVVTNEWDKTKSAFVSDLAKQTL